MKRKNLTSFIEMQKLKSKRLHGYNMSLRLKGKHYPWLARAWAEGEAKRASEQAKTPEAARDRWQKQGINKVDVDSDIQEGLNIDVTWLRAGNQSVEESMSRMCTLNEMAYTLRGKSKETIHKIMKKISVLM